MSFSDRGPAVAGFASAGTMTVATGRRGAAGAPVGASAAARPGASRRQRKAPAIFMARGSLGPGRAFRRAAPGEVGVEHLECGRAGYRTDERGVMEMHHLPAVRL